MKRLSLLAAVTPLLVLAAACVGDSPDAASTSSSSSSGSSSSSSSGELGSSSSSGGAGSTSSSGAPDVDGSVPPDAGSSCLLAWWKWQDDLTDSSGRGHQLASGAPTLAFITGKIGKAIQLTSGGYLEIADHADLRPSGDFTIEGWVYEGVANASSRILDKTTPQLTDGYLLDVLGGKLRVVVKDKSLVAPNALGINAWVHVAAVLEGASLRLYVAGTRVATAEGAPTIPTNGLPLRLGADGTATDPGSRFVGGFDELTINDRAFSDAEIADIVAGNKGPCRP